MTFFRTIRLVSALGIASWCKGYIRSAYREMPCKSIKECIGKTIRLMLVLVGHISSVLIGADSR